MSVVITSRTNEAPYILPAGRMLDMRDEIKKFMNQPEARMTDNAVDRLLERLIDIYRFGSQT